MRRTYLLTFLLICSALLPATVGAQRPIDFWVTPGTEGWNIIHKVEKGETIFMLARRYHVPPAILADANGVGYNDGLKERSSLIVPLGAYNLQDTKPSNMAEARALYYKVRPEDNMYRISRHTSVSQKTLADWNNMTEREVHAGQTLLVGWILFDATQMNSAGVVTSTARPPVVPVATTIKTQPRDTPKYVLHPTPVNMTTQEPPIVADTLPRPANTIEELFKEQTQDGKNLVWEKGSAAFFSLNNQATGADVFAFHNKAAKGSVIRVKNINNGRIIYVKVLGPLPLTKQYYNCIIGLNGRAKAALGVREAKAFCELSYAGY